MMRVLVVDGNAQDRDLAARYLQPVGHEVVGTSDIKSATAATDRRTPDVVVLDWHVTGAAPFLQRLRKREEGARPYVVVVSSTPSASELTVAIAGGADDYMRKPLVKEELVIRVGALDRIRTWAAKVFGGGSAAIDLASADVSRLHAWQVADQSIGKDIGELICQPMRTEAPAQASAPSLFGAQIPLTIVSEQTEVRLTVGVDAMSAPRLGELVLGDAAAPEDAVRDLLREIANTAAGSFVRAASQEGKVLTCGLPADLASGDLGPTRATAQRRFVIAPEDGSLRITFDLELLARALRRVNVGQLVEGMVLARDLHSEAGALLVPAGTRFTSSQIERMHRVVSARVTFDVAEAA